MGKGALAVVALAVLVTPAIGAGYPFLNAAIDYTNQGRTADAIIWFDKAIAAGDLVPDQMRAAYYGRGAAQLAQEKYPEAVDSFTAALALKPGDGMISRARAFAYLALGEFDKAFPDLKSAHAKYPDDHFIDFQTALAAWRLGNYQEAKPIFARLINYEPNAWYWLQLANAKLGLPIDASEVVNVDWPNHIRALYAGKIDAETAMKVQAESPGAFTKACDANFYVGEWRLIHGEAAGETLVQKAAEVCTWDTNRNEKSIAIFEVNKLTGRK
jgi:tetratricopeptide (TPR) repeat protein